MPSSPPVKMQNFFFTANRLLFSLFQEFLALLEFPACIFTITKVGNKYELGEEWKSKEIVTFRDTLTRILLHEQHSRYRKNLRLIIYDGRLFSEFRFCLLVIRAHPQCDCYWVISSQWPKKILLEMVFVRLIWIFVRWSKRKFAESVSSHNRSGPDLLGHLSKMDKMGRVSVRLSIRLLTILFFYLLRYDVADQVETLQNNTRH